MPAVRQNPPTSEIAQTASNLRALIGQYRRKLQEQASPGEFTIAQSSVVRLIELEGPATGTTLARAERMKPQSMGAILASLEERGIVSGTADPNDGRQTLWSITDAARQTILSARATKEDWLVRTIQAKLTSAEQRELATGVRLLARLLEP